MKELHPIKIKGASTFYGLAVVDNDNSLISYGVKIAEVKDGKPVIYERLIGRNAQWLHVKSWLKLLHFECGTVGFMSQKYGTGGK